MGSNDVYAELALMLSTDFRAGKGIITPEFDKILRMQYTPAEAALAVAVGIEGGTLSEIAKKLGKKEEELKPAFETMAKKGTLWIDPEGDDPVYRALRMEGMGIVETGMWAKDKFPEMAGLENLWHDFKYIYIEEGVTNAGALIPVLCAVRALPADAQPNENIILEMDKYNYWAVSPCPCRAMEPGNEGNAPEVCMMVDNVARWAVKNNFGRELTKEEAIKLLEKCEEDGLVHTGVPTYSGILCNCGSDYCVSLAGMKIGLPHTDVPSPFLAVCDEEACTACEICVDRCPVNAITVEDTAIVKPEVCIGCGVCVVGCEFEALSMVRRS